jgi:hypothetical protein
MSSSPGAATAIEQASTQHQIIEEKAGPPRAVLCIPGSGKLDTAAALILAYLLRHRRHWSTGGRGRRSINVKNLFA